MLKALELKNSKCGTFDTKNFDVVMTDIKSFCKSKKAKESKSCCFCNLNLYNFMKKRFQRFVRSDDLFASFESFKNSVACKGSSFYQTCTIELRSLIRSQIRMCKMDFIGAFVKKVLNSQQREPSLCVGRLPNAVFSYILCLQFVQLIVEGKCKEAILFAKNKLYSVLTWLPTSSLNESISHLDVTPIFEITKLIESSISPCANSERFVAEVIKGHRNPVKRNHAKIILTDSTAEINIKTVAVKFRINDVFSHDLNSYGNLYSLPSAIFKKSYASVMLPDFIELCLTLLAKCNHFMKGEYLKENLSVVIHQLSCHVNNVLLNLTENDDLTIFRSDEVTSINGERKYRHDYIGSCDLGFELYENVDIISICLHSFSRLKYFDSCVH